MRLRSIGLIVTLALGILLAPLAAKAQQTGRVYRIGYLGTLPPDTPRVARILEGFVHGLRDLGYVEGQNLVIERRYAHGRLERFPELAAELVRLKVDVIVAAAQAPHAAKRATGTIPIVMTNTADAVGSGLVASLARPGGNVTGLTLITPALVGKQLELLKEIVPTASRVAVLTNAGNRDHMLSLNEAAAAAKLLAVQLQTLEVRGPEDFDATFATMTQKRAHALLILGDAMFFGERQRLADLALKHRLAAASGLREFADAGAVLGYGASLPDLFRRAAYYVDKILKGAKPADLPVEQPTKFELVINLKTAKALGLTIPPSVLIRADEVIQ